MNNLINKIFGFIRNESLSISPKTKPLAAVQIGEKWGYIDTTGKIVVQPQFEEADYFI
ncbi:MAG: WG repeat-containing protein [Bacteroidales bacterium]|nr:WG repeat-containing protein [Bacteroidales bacterium]